MRPVPVATLLLQVPILVMKHFSLLPTRERLFLGRQDGDWVVEVLDGLLSGWCFTCCSNYSNCCFPSDFETRQLCHAGR